MDIAPAMCRRVDLGNLALGGLTAILFAYLYVPIIVIVVLSFNDSDLASFPLHGLTLRWFAQVFRDEQIVEGFRNSAVVGAAAVAITIPLALMFAYVMVRRASGGMSSLLLIVITTPMQTPRIILGVLLLLLFSVAGIRPGLITVLLGHVVLTLPFATLIIAARLRGIDTVLEEAALDLGASPLRMWVDILLPLLAPAVVAAGLISFTISFDEMVVSYFTIGTQSTLPIVIWTMVSQGYSQEINAAGTLVIALTLALITASIGLRRVK